MRAGLTGFTRSSCAGANLQPIGLARILSGALERSADRASQLLVSGRARARNRTAHCWARAAHLHLLRSQPGRPETTL